MKKTSLFLILLIANLFLLYMPVGIILTLGFTYRGTQLGEWLSWNIFIFIMVGGTFWRIATPFLVSKIMYKRFENGFNYIHISFKQVLVASLIILAIDFFVQPIVFRIIYVLIVSKL